MFLQFLRTSFRIFIRERIYSVLNIIGLSIGITVALIIFLYLQQDLTYDSYHLNAGNVFRVNSIFTSSGTENKFAMSPVSFGPRVKEEFPEVLAYTRIMRMNRMMLSYGEKKFYEENLYVADSTVFDVFTHRFIYGDPETCFRSSRNIVLTEKLARKYFGDKNPLGEVIILNKAQPMTVTAVIEDLPENVHARYDVLVPVSDPQGDSKNASFFNINVYTYLLFPENYDTQDFYDKFPAFYEKYVAAAAKVLNQQYKAVLQPFLKIHFSKEWQYDLPNGNRAYIIAFLVIGLLVLSLSCINYLNLTTARAERRRKEIAVKKILGSGRGELMRQFIGESMLMSVIAMFLALGIAQFVLGFTSLNQLIGKDLQIQLADNNALIAGIFLLTIFVGVASGLYPAIYLSSVHSLESMQGMNRPGLSAVALRKVLVISQMFISIGVIICTLYAGRQIEFVRRKDLGINKENLLIIPLRDTAVSNHITVLSDRLKENPSVISVTTANNVPSERMGNNLYRAETGNGMEENNFFTLVAGYDFLQTLGIKLVSGRNFDRSIQTDPRAAFLINETLAKKMGWNEPLGKRLQQNFSREGIPYFNGTVVGIVKDFNYASLHNAIEPLVIRVQAREGGQLLVKTDGRNMPGVMKFIQSVWKDMSAEFPEDYKFLDENFDSLYKKDIEQNTLVKIFSWICILISFLGLLSLSSYLTRIRTREIALRKVYGATAANILVMLYKEILLLVVIASIIASPVSYWLTGKLLGNFAYRTDLKIGIILVTIAGAVLVSIVTVTFNSMKASSSNPANSLKYE